jgi:predicted nucleotidyltransferase
MRLIVEMRFGSHLYSTATPLSDLDYKGVELPDGRDILLQRVQGHDQSITVESAGREELDR